MKTKLAHLIGLLTASLCLPAFAQGTAFTYQGRLNDGLNPASGSYDLTFSLWNAASGPAPVGITLTNSPVNVSNGLFTVTLDFGNQFPGPDRWLEIGVRTNGGGAFTSLSPRQPLTPAPYSIYAGSAASLAAASNQPVNLTANGTTVLRIESVFDPYYGSATANSLGGSSANIISNGFVGGFIGGGGNASYPNRVGADYASVLGGLGNTASGEASTAMGRSATASGFISTALGQSTSASGFISTAMGLGAVASGDNSTAMGWNATANGNVSTAMGFGTTASGWYSTAMGRNCTANGDCSTATGRQAKALHDGTFVWADNQVADFASTGNNQFCIRASGGVQLNTDTSFFFGSQTRQMLNLYGTAYAIGVQGGTEYFRSDGEFKWYRGGVHSDTLGDPGSGGTTAMSLNTGGLFVNGTFVSASDRNLKENFKPVSAPEVLEKVVALPLSRWNYRDDTASEHLGPMAQDFYAAFGVGPDDKHIATVDESGVALAAIQGLNEKLEARTQRSEDRMRKLESENADLKKELANLKGMVERLAQPRKEH